MGLEQRTSVAKADPYLLFGLLSKKIIHPGGRCATEELLAEGDFRSEHRVLDIGCGVATTSLEIARRFGSTVIAADISIDIRERANTNVRRAGLNERISVEAADICALPFPRSLLRPRGRGSGDHVRRP